MRGFVIPNLTLLLLVLVAVVILPCKRDEKRWVSIDNFCAEFSKAFDTLGSKIRSCIGDKELEFEWYTERCETLVRNAKRAAETRGSVSFDSQTAQAVVDELMSMSKERCEDLIKLSSLRKFSRIVYNAERKIFIGKLGENAECFFDFECQSGLCGRDSCPGVCILPAGEGEKCSTDVELEGGKPCGEGLACYKDLCTRSGPAGAPCDDDIDCDADLICVSRFCQKPTPAGSYCESDTPCEYMHLCNFEKKICRDVGYAKEGEVCGNLDGKTILCDFSKNYCSERSICEPLPGEDQDCAPPQIQAPQVMKIIQGKGVSGIFMYRRCKEGLFCDSDGKCRKLPREGESCKLTCADNLICIEGKCHRVRDIGEVCVYNYECKTLRCEDGICKSKLKEIGQYCESSKECQNLNCRGKICCSP